jgi:Tfp pilus assembly protein PilP
MIFPFLFLIILGAFGAETPSQSSVALSSPSAATAPPAANSSPAPAHEDIEARFKAQANSTATLTKEALLKLAEIRDPFQKPDFAQKVRSVLPLEQFPVEQLQLIGVITGPNQVRALIRTPDGKTHIVTEKTRLGTSGGSIQRITPVSITVRERIHNALLGEDEVLDKVLKVKGAQGGSG